MKQPKLGPKGLKYKINQVIDTVPSQVTRDINLEPITINNHISKFNIIDKLMVGNPLSSNIKKELLKLLNSKVFDEYLLMNNMPYLNEVIKALCENIQMILHSHHI